MKHEDVTLSEEACDDIISQLVEQDADYRRVSYYLETEIAEFLGEDEEK